jgi:Putative Ig domain.
LGDPQGLPVNLSVEGLPAGASFDRRIGRFTWTPNETQTGVFTVAVTAISRAGAATTEEILIQVLRDQAAIITARNSANLEFSDFCSPGSWATLLGVAFTEQYPLIAQEIPLPTNLGGVEVSVNDSPVPLLYVAQSQINFQCPRLPIGSAIQVTVKTETGFTSLPFSGVMREATPALFTMGYSGSGQGAVLIANSYEVAMPPTNEIPSRPARRGEFLSVYANGLGEVVELVPVGSPAPLDPLIGLKDTVRVFLGGVEVSPDFAGLAPGAIGLYQIDVPVTAAVPSGPNVPLRVEVTRADGSAVTSNEVTVAIE